MINSSKIWSPYPGIGGHDMKVGLNEGVDTSGFGKVMMMALKYQCLWWKIGSSN